MQKLTRKTPSEERGGGSARPGAETGKYLHDLWRFCESAILLAGQDRFVHTGNPAAEKTWGKLDSLPCHRLLFGRDEPCAQCPIDSEGEGAKERVECSDSKEVHCIPVGFEEGRATALAIRADPLTRDKKAESDLHRAQALVEEANRVKNKFVSLVAHDLKSPLATILGLTELLEMDNLAPARRKELHSQVKTTARHLVRMVNELLNLSRLQSGALVLKPKFFDARQMVNFALGALRFLADEKGIETRNELPRGERVFADPDLLLEVLKNLLDNAIKFSRKGDRIHFFFPPGQKGVIAIRDTGIGISDTLQAALFLPEVKTSRPGTAGEKGTGLGLPYCQEIVRAHGGQITVESKPGEGTTFEVLLPSVQPRILIIDDEVEGRFLVRTTLRALRDVEFLEAENAEMGLSMLHEKPVHLVISDIWMPGMDGFEFLRKLKSEPMGRDLPIIMITAGKDMETRDRVIKLGAADFVGKPLTEEELIPRIRRFIA